MFLEPLPLLASLILVAGGGFGSLLQDRPPADLPPMQRYEPPRFPVELRASALLDGHATAGFTLAQDGKVIDVVILESSREAFARELTRAVRGWRLRPLPSATTPRREVVRYVFLRTGMVGTATHHEASQAAFFPYEDDGSGVTTLQARQLPSAPVRIAGTLPSYPPELKDSGVQGQVAVSYIIDTLGNVRVPVVVRAADLRLGSAVLSAVSQWRFAPVRHDDHAILVEDVRVFTFGHPSPGTSPSPQP